jgi:hypothetical protein
VGHHQHTSNNLSSLSLSNSRSSATSSLGPRPTLSKMDSLT